MSSVTKIALILVNFQQMDNFVILNYVNKYSTFRFFRNIGILRKAEFIISITIYNILMRQLSLADDGMFSRKRWCTPR